MQSICCILGAGYSHAAGAPLTKDLFANHNVAIPSDASFRKFHAVWNDYEAWLQEHPLRNLEEYLAYLLNHSYLTAWTANERYVLNRSIFEADAATPGSTLPFPDCPVPPRFVPPFAWAVELLGAVLATPLPCDTTATNFRYGACVTFPLHCHPHAEFWQEVLEKASRIAAITTNYDIFIERTLRHRQMTRTFVPGCYYGGIPKPQLLLGIQRPWAYQGNHILMSGAIPLYKLHGSLNWSQAGGKLKLFQDLRPAFRAGGNAAIIPPMPEKEIPTWLEPVWSGAESELAAADVWIVCGYSLPSYDIAITQLLRRAASRGNLKSILVLDPYAAEVCCRYSSSIRNVPTIALEGLPRGSKRLRDFL